MAPRQLTVNPGALRDGRYAVLQVQTGHIEAEQADKEYIRRRGQVMSITPVLNQILMLMLIMLIGLLPRKGIYYDQHEGD